MSTSAPALGIPPFFCPIEPAVHVDVAEAERRALAWASESGLCRSPEEQARVAGTRSAEFYARFAPYADLDRLWVTACWVYWGFAFDDARCDDGPLAEDPAGFAAMAFDVQRALETPGALGEDGPYAGEQFAASLHDLGERFRALTGPVQNRRFHNAHRAWLTGVQWQVGNRARRRMPGLDEYLTMRLHSAGGEPTFAMLEIADGMEVPGREMDSPAVCALTEAAILVAALDNDRHSLAKEESRSHTDQNIFTVLTEHEGLSSPRARHEAIALRDGVLCRFLELREKVLPRAGRELRRYLSGLALGIRGNIEWGLRTPRYLDRVDGSAGGGAGAGQSDANPAGERAWAASPLSGEIRPRRLESIGWWWQDLTL